MRRNGKQCDTMKENNGVGIEEKWKGLGWVEMNKEGARRARSGKKRAGQPARTTISYRRSAVADESNQIAAN